MWYRAELGLSKWTFHGRLHVFPKSTQVWRGNRYCLTPQQFFLWHDLSEKAETWNHWCGFKFQSKMDRSVSLPFHWLSHPVRCGAEGNGHNARTELNFRVVEAILSRVFVMSLIPQLSLNLAVCMPPFLHGAAQFSCVYYRPKLVSARCCHVDLTNDSNSVW